MTNEEVSIERCRKLLKEYATNGPDWSVLICLKLASQMIHMVEHGEKAIHGVFILDGKDYHFDFYTEKSALTELEATLRKTITVPKDNPQ